MAGAKLSSSMAPFAAARLDRRHVGVRQAEMVADLVHQHML